MNSIKLQNTVTYKNQLHFYILRMKYLKKKLKKKPIPYNSIKNNKILRNKRKQEVKDLYVENHKTLMKLETQIIGKVPMLMGQKN